MILLPILTLLSGFFISLAVHHLNQTISSYYDFVALIMVAGGTFAVAIVLLPWEYRKDLVAAAKNMVRPEKRLYRTVLLDCLKTLQSRHYESTEKSPALYQKILRDGLELVQLGFSKEKIEHILSERVFQATKRGRKIASAVKSLAKYPPAFGLMGTVLGLVNIMKQLASATDASKLGAEMSVALVATMYGLLLANFAVSPIGEYLVKKVEEEEEYAEISLSTVLLFKSEDNFSESHELLNSMVPEEQRIGFDEMSQMVNAA